MKISRILLIDDDHIANFISSTTIQKLQLADEITIKKDGSEALAYLEKECRALDTYPELILLDLKMPGMDGFQFLRIFEALCRKIMHNITVVVLTSSRAADDVIRLRSIGKYYLMNKPLTTDKIVDIYHRYFRHRKEAK